MCSTETVFFGFKSKLVVEPDSFDCEALDWLSRENSCLQLWISPTSGGAPTPTLASTQASYNALYNNFLHFALPLREETRLKIRPKMRHRKLKIVQIMQNCKTGQVDQTDQGDQGDQTDQGDWGDQSFMTMAHV